MLIFSISYSQSSNFSSYIPTTEYSHIRSHTNEHIDTLLDNSTSTKFLNFNYSSGKSFIDNQEGAIKTKSFNSNSSSSNFSFDVIQSGYSTVMGVIFNADGTKMFVWEKRGHVYVSNWNGSTYVKQETPVLDISDEVGHWLDFGFASFCLDPDFDTNGLVYMFYHVDREYLTSLVDCDDASSSQDCIDNPPPVPSPYDPNDNDYYQATIGRLTRYKLNIGSDPLIADYNSRKVLLGETPSTGVPLTHESHGGGTVIFGNDGTLLVSTGDNASYTSIDIGSASETYYQQAINDGILRPEENVGAFRSQMITSLCGKILRLDPETGDGVPSNPYYDASNPRAAKSRIWEIGLRNPFRMSILPGSGSSNPADGNPGTIFVADVGFKTWEDLHIFDKGGLNGGWPLYEGLTQLDSYYNSGVTNPDEGNALFKDNCVQPTNFIDNPDPAQRRFVHDRPEVAWKHGDVNDARVPWFNGTTPTDPRVGTSNSPTTGIQFRGNTAIGGVYITGNALGSSMNGKYLFTDYVRNWINAATLTDGTQNWISDISEIAPIGTGSGIVQMTQNPLDGFVYYVNIWNSTVTRMSFTGLEWTNEPSDMTVECDGNSVTAFTNWLSSFSGTDTCGTATVTHNSLGLSTDCGNTGSETVTFTLSDECGNQITKNATFTIEDNTDPTWTNEPSDMTVEWDGNSATAFTNWLTSFSGTDTCGTATVTHNSSGLSDDCGNTGSETVTFTLSDECGNQITKDATFTIEDNTDPTWIVEPSDYTFSCDGFSDPDDTYNAWLSSFSGEDSNGTATISYNNFGLSYDCNSAGTVSVLFTLTDECGNYITKQASFTIENTLGIDKESIEELKIYPNPTEHSLTISGLKTEGKVLIFDILGKQFKNLTVKNKVTFNLGLPSGIYLVKIVVDDKSTVKKLIVK